MRKFRRPWPVLPGVAAILSLGCTGTPSGPPADETGPIGPLAATAPLVPGDALPPLEAAGWVNGPPSPGAKVLVVDVWADWCPFCRATAPGLVEVHRKYAGKGVRFVSLTSMPKPMAEQFATRHGVTWPSGYLAMHTITALGATNPDAKVPGYDAAPTLYVAGPDNKVRWSDERARYRHVEPKVLLRDLEAAIDKVLAEGPE